jgi:dTDP-4-dehydrorhamnose reductase
MAADDYFFYVSKSIVFGVGGMHSESSKVNPISMASKTLSVMEKNVLRYGKGVVVRVHSLVEEFALAVQRVIDGESLPESEWYPVSKDVVDTVTNALISGYFCTSSRILHLVGSEPQSLYGEAIRYADVEPRTHVIRQPRLTSEVVCGIHAVNLYLMNSAGVSKFLSERFVAL